MSDTPRTDAAWLKRADSPRRQCSEQLERELSAYQAELLEADHAELVKHMREESFDCPLCAQAADYLDALAKRCAWLEVELETASEFITLYGWLRQQKEHLAACFEEDAMTPQTFGLADICMGLSTERLDSSIRRAIAAGKEKAE